MAEIEATQAIPLSDYEEETDDELSPAEKKPFAHLNVRAQKGLERVSYPVYEGKNVIGRAESCDITLSYKAMSKEHACIEVKGASHIIYDKGSRNKTRRAKLFLEPEVRYELRDNDVLTFGDIKCVYEIIRCRKESLAGSETGSESMLIGDPLGDDENKNDSRVGTTGEAVSEPSSDILEPTQAFGTYANPAVKWEEPSEVVSHEHTMYVPDSGSESDVFEDSKTRGPRDEQSTLYIEEDSEAHIDDDSFGAFAATQAVVSEETGAEEETQAVGDTVPVEEGPDKESKISGEEEYVIEETQAFGAEEEGDNNILDLAATSTLACHDMVVDDSDEEEDNEATQLFGDKSGELDQTQPCVDADATQVLTGDEAVNPTPDRKNVKWNLEATQIFGDHSSTHSPQGTSGVQDETQIFFDGNETQIIEDDGNTHLIKSPKGVPTAEGEADATQILTTDYTVLVPDSQAEGDTSEENSTQIIDDSIVLETPDRQAGSKSRLSESSKSRADDTQIFGDETVPVRDLDSTQILEGDDDMIIPETPENQLPPKRNRAMIGASYVAGTSADDLNIKKIDLDSTQVFKEDGDATQILDETCIIEKSPFVPTKKSSLSNRSMGFVCKGDETLMDSTQILDTNMSSDMDDTQVFQAADATQILEESLVMNTSRTKYSKETTDIDATQIFSSDGSDVDQKPLNIPKCGVLESTLLISETEDLDDTQPFDDIEGSEGSKNNIKEASVAKHDCTNKSHEAPKIDTSYPDDAETQMYVIDTEGDTSGETVAMGEYIHPDDIATQAYDMENKTTDDEPDGDEPTSNRSSPVICQHPPMAETLAYDSDMDDDKAGQHLAVGETLVYDIDAEVDEDDQAKPETPAVAETVAYDMKIDVKTDEQRDRQHLAVGETLAYDIDAEDDEDDKPEPETPAVAETVAYDMKIDVKTDEKRDRQHLAVGETLAYDIDAEDDEDDRPEPETPAVAETVAYDMKIDVKTDEKRDRQHLAVGETLAYDIDAEVDEDDQAKPETPAVAETVAYDMDVDGKQNDKQKKETVLAETVAYDMDSEDEDDHPRLSQRLAIGETLAYDMNADSDETDDELPDLEETTPVPFGVKRINITRSNIKTVDSDETQEMTQDDDIELPDLKETSPRAVVDKASEIDEMDSEDTQEITEINDPLEDSSKKPRNTGAQDDNEATEVMDSEETQEMSELVPGDIEATQAYDYGLEEDEEAKAEPGQKESPKPKDRHISGDQVLLIEELPADSMGNKKEELNLTKATQRGKKKGSPAKNIATAQLTIAPRSRPQRRSAAQASRAWGKNPEEELPDETNSAKNDSSVVAEKQKDKQAGDQEPSPSTSGVIGTAAAAKSDEEVTPSNSLNDKDYTIKSPTKGRKGKEVGPTKAKSTQEVKQNHSTTNPNVDMPGSDQSCQHGKTGENLAPVGKSVTIIVTGPENKVDTSTNEGRTATNVTKATGRTTAARPDPPHSVSETGCTTSQNDPKISPRKTRARPDPSPSGSETGSTTSQNDAHKSPRKTRGGRRSKLDTQPGPTEEESSVPSQTEKNSGRTTCARPDPSPSGSETGSTTSQNDPNKSPRKTRGGRRSKLDTQPRPTEEESSVPSQTEKNSGRTTRARPDPSPSGSETGGTTSQNDRQKSTRKTRGGRHSKLDTQPGPTEEENSVPSQTEKNSGRTTRARPDPSPSGSETGSTTSQNDPNKSPRKTRGGRRSKLDTQPGPTEEENSVPSQTEKNSGRTTRTRPDPSPSGSETGSTTSQNDPNKSHRKTRGGRRSKLDTQPGPTEEESSVPSQTEKNSGRMTRARPDPSPSRSETGSTTSQNDPQKSPRKTRGGRHSKLDTQPGPTEEESSVPSQTEKNSGRTTRARPDPSPSGSETGSTTSQNDPRKSPRKTRGGRHSKLDTQPGPTEEESSVPSQTEKNSGRMTHARPDPSPSGSETGSTTSQIDLQKSPRKTRGGRRSKLDTQPGPTEEESSVPSQTEKNSGRTTRARPDPSPSGSETGSTTSQNDPNKSPRKTRGGRRSKLDTQPGPTEEESSVPSQTEKNSGRTTRARPDPSPSGSETGGTTSQIDLQKSPRKTRGGRRSKLDTQPGPTEEESSESSQTKSVRFRRSKVSKPSSSTETSSQSSITASQSSISDAQVTITDSQRTTDSQSSTRSRRSTRGPLPNSRETSPSDSASQSTSTASQSTRSTRGRRSQEPAKPTTSVSAVKQESQNTVSRPRGRPPKSKAQAGTSQTEIVEPTLTRSQIKVEPGPAPTQSTSTGTRRKRTQDIKQEDTGGEPVAKRGRRGAILPVIKEENNNSSAFVAPTVRGRRKRRDSEDSQNSATSSQSSSNKRSRTSLEEPQTPRSARRSCVLPPASGSPGLRARGNLPHVMFTGFIDDNAQKARVRTLKALGGDMAESIFDCTHLVTDKVRRTVKFLCAVARGIPIVNTDWLDECSNKKKFVNAEDFHLKDKENEKTHKFNLEVTLRKASRKPMLMGYKIHVTKSVLPEPKQMSDIIKCAGGELVTVMPKKAEPNLVVVSSPNDENLCNAAHVAGIPIVTAEFILTGILRQEADVKLHQLITPTSSRRGKR